MSDFLSPVSATATSRRRYPVEYKRQVVQESMLSGASIARTAMAHGINANQLHNWRWQYRRGYFEVATQEPILLPAQIQAAQALHKSPALAVGGQVRRTLQQQAVHCAIGLYCLDRTQDTQEMPEQLERRFALFQAEPVLFRSGELRIQPASGNYRQPPIYAARWGLLSLTA